MSALEDRVREAVGAAEHRGEGLRGAFVAFLRVLEDAFDLPTPDPSDTPRDLPTEPGAFILGTAQGAPTLRPMLLAKVGDTFGRPEWQYVDDDGDGCSTWLLDEWRPALVVPDDEDGPVAALRRVLDVGVDRDVPHDEARDLMVTDAREALARLDGGES